MREVKKKETQQLRERGALPEEEGDAVREYKAMHEEKFSRKDGREKEEIMMKVSTEKEEEKERKEEKRRGERRERNGDW